jgi:hypothetical protein
MSMRSYGAEDRPAGQENGLLAGAGEEQVAIRVGLLGEIEVELQLVRHGWHPVRLDTAQMASNADLLAINRRHRVAIQVKTTDADKQHSHSEWLGFGYSTGYIREKRTIFNAKNSPLIADVVIGVSYRASGTRFVVMPVALAETLCRRHCDYWSSVPTRTEKGTRSDSFPIYLCFTADRKPHRVHHERIKRNLMAYENRWDILAEPVGKLHDAGAWLLLD